MPRELTATFEVVTPLFLGGADPACTVELRPASIKGALRFWWRALAWGRLKGDLMAIHRDETQLFGTAADENEHENLKTGQASFRVRVRAANKPKVLNKGEQLRAGKNAVVGPGARYLGYGLIEAYGAKQGHLNRPCVVQPFQFSVDLISRDPLDATLIEALKLMGLLGGIGARARRGYGSLSILSLSSPVETWHAPKNKQDYADRLRTIIQVDELQATEPPYSAFSKRTRVVICDSGADPLGLLDHVGRQMQRYRSWGHNGKVNGEPSERNFPEDHDWFNDRKNFTTSHPKRVVFGLPHNYSKEVGIVTQSYERRASPLCIHIHKLNGGEYVAVLTIMRSRFLPEGEKLLVRNDRHKSPREPEIDWDVLDRFIDGNSKMTGKPYFPNRTPILR